ncbi:MAG: TatD family hydrolase [Patescibacteria group bacterium]
MLIDTHCHLDFPQFKKDFDTVLARAGEAGIGKMINPGVGIKESRQAVELAKNYENIFAAVGIHPHEASSLFELRSPGVNSLNEGVLAELEELAEDPKVIAIGEIGLDYFRMRNEKSIQQEAFRKQLELAQKLKKPVIIHSREADEDIFKILDDFEVQGVFHCFGGDWAFAQQVLERGFLIGLTGVVTFPKAVNTHEVAANVPLEKLLVETDAPFLAPQKFRGQRCEPAFVREVGERIAELKGVSLEEVAGQTTKNARKLFELF